MGSNTTEGRLAELLLLWEELRDRGRETTPEEFCRECPEMIPLLGPRIEQLRLWDRFQGDTPRLEPDAPAPDLRRLPDDRYEILEKLGEGGMGEVFKARHRVMDKIVALKMLPAQAATTSARVRRFGKEMLAGGRLSHPNIVQVFDAVSNDDVHYLVMEFVEGEDLARVVGREGPLPVDRAVDYLRQAARALEHAHEMGIVHLDVKPSNLMLTTGGTIKVLDFGLARLGSGPTTDASTTEASTARKCFQGTAQYAAPEQAFDAGRVDQRADIYGLGCTLHFLLTGSPPYRGEGTLPTLLAHREGPIPGIGEVRPDVPAALDATFRRMLAKAPADRFGSMSEVIDALENPGSIRMGDDPGDTTDVVPGRASEAPASPGSPKHVPATTSLSPGQVGRRVAATIVLVLAVGLFAWAVVLRFVTPGGTIVVEVDQPGAEVTVDRRKVKIVPGDGSEPITVEIDEGTHFLVVRKDGFEAFSKQFKITSREQKTIVVRLEPRPDTDRPSEVDVDRIAALWALKVPTGSNGIRVAPVDTNRRITVHHPGELPTTPFYVISIDFWGVRAIDDASIRNLAGLRHLEDIGLNGTTLGDDGLRVLARIPSLRQLDLGGTGITDAAAASLLQLKDLERLSLVLTRFGDDGLKAIGSLKKIRILILGGSRVTDAGIEHLNAFPRLTQLDLARLRVTDAGLGRLRPAGTLEVLDLVELPITAAGFVKLVEQHPGLQSLNLTFCGVGDDWLTAMLKLDKLTLLVLNDCDVTDEDMESVARVRGLRTLHLNRTGVTDAGLRRLEGLRLTELSVEGTRTTAAGRSAYRRARPGCRVIPED